MLQSTKGSCCMNGFDQIPGLHYALSGRAHYLHTIRAAFLKTLSCLN